MPRVHTFIVPEPGEPELEILELTGTEVQRIAENASKDHPLDIVKSTVIEAKLKRLQCVRGYGDLHVNKGDKSHDILAAMSARAQQFCDRAIDHVHDVRSEEMAPFFATRKTTEV